MKTVDPDREKKMMLRLAAHFSRGADIIKLPYTLEEYESKKESVHEMEKICDELEQREAQVISAIFVDANDVPVLAYCGHRQKTENRRTVNTLIKSNLSWINLFFFFPSSRGTINTKGGRPQI